MNEIDRHRLRLEVLNIAKLFPEGYKARAEQAIVFSVEAWNENRSQHIPQMFFAEDVAEVIGQL